MTKRAGLALSLICALVLAGTSVAAFAETHARIIRVSYLDGQVQMDRATGQGLERAMLNAPVVQGASIVSGKDGLAEVEFEDQTAIRLTENSEVRFRQLSMNDAGGKTNDIEVVNGVVYFDVRSKIADTYRVGVGGSSLLIHRDTQLRLSANPDQLTVAVLKGEAQLENQPQIVTVKKKETLTLNPGDPSQYKVAVGTETIAVDAWNKERQAYGEAYAKSEGLGGPKSGYGLQDLNYYGSFSYAPGYGSVWQPYGFAGSMTGFDPYSNGAWMFYPGMGYAFASGYPWGWLPYHYGSWAYIGGMGWAWVPGGNYGNQWYANNFQTAPKITKAPAGWSPASPPAASAGTPGPTVVLGKAATPNAVIPGGRVPPNFASVIRGRSSAPSVISHDSVGANAQSGMVNDHVFGANTVRQPAHTGHVFVAPPPAVGLSTGMPIGGPGYGASSGAVGGVSPTATSSAGHASTTSHGSSASHK